MQLLFAEVALNPNPPPLRLLSAGVALSLFGIRMYPFEIVLHVDH